MPYVLLSLHGEEEGRRALALGDPKRVFLIAPKGEKKLVVRSLGRKEEKEETPLLSNLGRQTILLHFAPLPPLIPLFSPRL